MKKIICAILSLAMVLILGVSAFAADSTITVETVTKEAKVGDTVVVGISVSDTEISGIQFLIDYDKARLKLVGYEDSGLTGWTVGVGTANESANWYSPNNKKIKGNILNLKFEVIENAESGKAYITLKDVQAVIIGEKDDPETGESNEVEIDVPFSVVSGGITVKGVCKHVNTEVRNEKAATCAAEGYTGDTYCKDCGEKISNGASTPKDPQNHTGETEIKNEKKATCGAKGYTGDTYCKGCGVKLSDGKETEIDPNNHNFGAWKITKEATKDAEGVKERTCSICNKVETVKIPRLSDNTEPIHISANGESKGEKNPNTGAESAIGVVGLAAVCTGAYIVGKKHR